MATNNSWNSPALDTNGNLLIGSTGTIPVQGTLTAPAAGITISEGAGSITFALADDLAAVEALASAGMVARTAADTWVVRTITGGTGITVNNGDGVSGAPEIVLDTPVSVANGGTGAVSLTDGGILLGSGTGPITATAQPANGELLMGSVGVDPVLNTLTAGAGIGIVEGAGTITISSSISGFTWVEETGTSRSAAVGEAIIANNAGLVTITLPDTAVLGSVLIIVGKGAGGWLLAQNASELTHFGTSVTTTGVGGSLASTEVNDSITLVCIVADTEWLVYNSIGNITVV